MLLILLLIWVSWVLALYSVVVFGFALGFLITSMLGLFTFFGGLYRDGRSVKNGSILGMSRFLIIDILRLHSCLGL